MWFVLGVSGSGHSTNTSLKCKQCAATSFLVTFVQVIQQSLVHPGAVFMLMLLIVLAIMAAHCWHLQHPVCGRGSALIQDHPRSEGEFLEMGLELSYLLFPVYVILRRPLFLLSMFAKISDQFKGPLTAVAVQGTTQC